MENNQEKASPAAFAPHSAITPAYKYKLTANRFEHSAEWRVVEDQVGKELFPGRILPLSDTGETLKV